MGSQLSAEQLAEFKHARADAIVACEKGEVFWEFKGDSDGTAAIEPYIGKEYKDGEVLCHINTPWGEIAPVGAALGGRLVEINARQGSHVKRGDVIAYIERTTAS